MDSPVTFLLLVFFLFPLPSIPAVSPTLSSCLRLSGVHNFSVTNITPFYRRILCFSIQNRRFSHPSLPLPAAVILPADLRSLRSSILCCRAAGVGIRLRSGGHSYEGLSYLSGAVIDLMNLDGVKVDAVAGTAWVQAGATLGQLYHAVAATRSTLAFSAGSCPTVGAGGHIAGGGFGLLSRKYGLAADNVVDAVMVSPDGDLLDRGTMGEELFWAIRGGGGGTWGAVYAWKVRLEPVPDRVSAFTVNRSGSNRRLAKLIYSWQKAAPALPDEFYVSCFVGGSLPESGRVGMSATFKGLYLGPGKKARSIITDRFPELGLLEWEVREMSWIESVVYFSGLTNGSSIDDLLDRELHEKTFFKGKSDYVRAHIGLPDLIGMVSLLSTEPKAYIIMDPYGGEMARRRTDELPFPHRAGNLYAIQHLIQWSEDEDGGREGYMRWLREWYEFMGPLVSGGPRAAYVNYLDLDLGYTSWATTAEGTRDPVEDSRVWGERYYLGNYDRLVEVKTSIDPDNVFRNEQSIPPLTSGFKVHDDA